MAAPAWIEPFLTWLTSNPITTTALRRIEGNIKHLRDGDTVFSGTKQFQNNVEMLSQLIVRAETILREVVQISGSLSMLGNITVNERPGFGGTGNVTVSTGNVQLSSGNLTLTSGNSSVGGNSSVSGNISVDGSLDFKSLGPRSVSTITHTSITDTAIPQGWYYANGVATGTTGQNVGSGIILSTTGSPSTILITDFFGAGSGTQFFPLFFCDGSNMTFSTFETISPSNIGNQVHTLTLVKVST